MTLRSNCTSIQRKLSCLCSCGSREQTTSSWKDLFSVQNEALTSSPAYRYLLLAFLFFSFQAHLLNVCVHELLIVTLSEEQIITDDFFHDAARTKISSFLHLTNLGTREPVQLGELSLQNKHFRDRNDFVHVRCKQARTFHFLLLSLSSFLLKLPCSCCPCFVP